MRSHPRKAAASCRVAGNKQFPSTQNRHSTHLKVRRESFHVKASLAKGDIVANGVHAGDIRPLRKGHGMRPLGWRSRGAGR